MSSADDLFCARCEAILPIADFAPCTIKCLVCGAEKLFSIPSMSLKVDQQERTFHRAAVDLDYAELAMQDQVIQVEHICEKCGHNLASYTTQQTRSADEGQTVFYTCLNFLENTSQSALGTKKYWDEYYSREIINFEETGDKGEIWFGKQSERKILKFITENVDDVAGAKIVELGMGNASLLRKLRENGYRNLHGIDYSPNALELARRACDAKTNSDARIHFHLIDLTAANAVEAAGLHDRFDCIVDKGTWDAISLTSGDKAMCLRNYRDAVIELARTHSSSEKLSPFFIIVSCNFTRKELEEMFECEKIVFYKELPSATTVTFSGRTGSTFTGEVFRIQKQ